MDTLSPTRLAAMRFARRAALMIGWAMAATPALAAEYPTPREGSWVARDFRFHTGEVMPELRIGYATVGEPSGIPVVVLHGTAGSARNCPATSGATVSRVPATAAAASSPAASENEAITPG